jgi:hypothetical protein
MSVFRDDFSADTSTRGNLIVGEKVGGEVGHPGDRDWFRIFLFGDLRYRFNLIGDSLVDPTLFCAMRAATSWISMTMQILN